MICPTCGKLNENGRAYCTECGARLFDPTEKAEQAFDAALESVSDAAEATVGDANDTAANIYASVSETGIPVAPVEPPKPVEAPKPYVNHAALVANKPAPTVKKSEENTIKIKNAPAKPLSTWGFVWRTFLFLVPILNLILLFSFAFSNGINPNSRAYARCWLIYMLIGAVILIACAVVWYFFAPQIADYVSNFAANLQSLVN